MPDQAMVSDLLVTTIQSLSHQIVYWAVIALVGLDVVTGLVNAVLRRELDPQRIRYAAIKFFQTSAILCACVALQTISDALVAATYPIIASVTIGEMLSILQNMRQAYESRGMQPPDWMDQVTVFLKGFPNQTAKAQAQAASAQLQGD